MLTRHTLRCNLETMMDNQRHNKGEALTPMTLAERWISRLAVRAVIAKQKSRAIGSAGSPAQPDEKLRMRDVEVANGI